jgi:hypothetical protein
METENEHRTSSYDRDATGGTYSDVLRSRTRKGMKVSSAQFTKWWNVCDTVAQGVENKEGRGVISNTGQGRHAMKTDG